MEQQGLVCFLGVELDFFKIFEGMNVVGHFYLSDYHTKFKPKLSGVGGRVNRSDNSGEWGEWAVVCKSESFEEGVF